MAKPRRGLTAIQQSRRLTPSQKATFHQVTGAGPSRVKREFFGISPLDEAVIEQELGLRIDINLQREG